MQADTSKIRKGSVVKYNQGRKIGATAKVLSVDENVALLQDGARTFTRDVSKISPAK